MTYSNPSLPDKQESFYQVPDGFVATKCRECHQQFPMKDHTTHHGTCGCICVRCRREIEAWEMMFGREWDIYTTIWNG